MTSPKIANCIAAVLFAFTLLVGCTEQRRPATFSTVFRGDYDPVTALQQAGYEVRTPPGSKGVSNAEYGYAWRSWEGMLLAPEGNEGCEAAAIVIRDALSKVTSNGDELTGQSSRKLGQPLTGMLFYNKDGMHGDMHVWLIPDEAEKVISYVIFLREEKLLK